MNWAALGPRVKVTNSRKSNATAYSGGSQYQRQRANQAMKPCES